MKKIAPKGFTVLEFIIVTGMIILLVSLILVGLQNARENARDQIRISNLQSVALAIQQYHDVCREYPSDLISSESCDALLPNGTLGDFIKNIDDYQFNTGGEYNYVGIAADQANPVMCTNFHLWVQLENKTRTTNSAKFDSTYSVKCQATIPPETVDATQATDIYDIYR